MQSKKLVEMSREELLEVCQKQSEVLARHRKYASIPDLPPNREANERHQRMKHLWGLKKKEYLLLLNRCTAHLPSDSELRKDIEYALAHDEFLHWKNGGRSGFQQRRLLKKFARQAEIQQLKEQLTALQSQLAAKGEEVERKLLMFMRAESPATITQIAAEARRIVEGK